MSIFEYNKEEEERKLRKAEYEAGYDSGYDLGRKEGIEENMRKIVCAMLASGEMIEKIAQYTGYSVQEIEKLNKNENKIRNQDYTRRKLQAFPVMKYDPLKVDNNF